MDAVASPNHSRVRSAGLSRLVFFALPVAYSLTFARYWISDVDEGFLIGNAWRVVNGQLPHRDFIYVRPALPILIQSFGLLALPESLQFLASRIWFYVGVAVYSLVASHLLVRAYGARAARIDPFLLAAASFVFSAHDFPPMAWHTTDGLLFASLGLALLFDARSAGVVALGSLCMVLAALCKQPFYAVAALAPAFAGLVHGRRTGVMAALWLAAGALAALGAMAAFGIAHAFLQQTARGLGAGGGFLSSGVFAYLGASFAPWLVGLTFWWLARDVAARRGRELDPGVAVGVGVVSLFALVLVQAARPQLAWLALVQSHYDPFALAWVCAALVALDFSRARRDWLVLAMLLFVSWASGITWGAQGPGLFAPPLVFAVLYFAAEKLHSRRVRALEWLLVAGGVITFSLTFFVWPQGFDPGPKYPTVDLATLSPKLRFIRGSPYSYAKYQELLAAHERYGDRLTVLPGMELSYFLFGTVNPLPLDMVRTLELGGEEPWFQLSLDSNVDYALLERLVRRPDGHWEPDIVDQVRETWTHVETLEHFEVYRNPRLGADVDPRLPLLDGAR